MRLILATVLALGGLVPAAWALAPQPAAAPRYGAAAIGVAIRPDGAPGLATGAPSLVVFSSVVQIPWSGSGALIRAPLCIASPSGRYRLTVTSAGGGKLQGASPLVYGIRFMDGAGVVQQAAAPTGPMVAFEGSSGGLTACLAASNAAIDLVVPQESLTGATAGSYMDRITLKVDPL